MNLIRNFFLILLTFALYNETNAQGCPILKSKKRMICYFASWAGIDQLSCEFIFENNYSD